MEPECFLRGNCRTLAEFDLTDRLPSVSGREQNPRKSSAESWARWDWKNRKVATRLKKKRRRKARYMPFRKHGTRSRPFFRSAALIRPRIVTHSPPSVHLLPAVSTALLPLLRSLFRPHSLFREYFFPI